MANLKLSLEMMGKYGLRMNPLKCTFEVTSGKFLGFVVHERGIQIDPKKIVNRQDWRIGVQEGRPKAAG
jgi:hypothetical protein